MNTIIVPIELLLASEHNPRSSMDEAKLNELTASIQQDGLLEPIRGVREGDYIRVESGHRRHQAALAAGLAEVPVALIEQDSATEAVRALVTNVQREDLNPVDEARHYQHLVATHGLTTLGAAQRVGVSPTRVTQRLELLEFHEDIVAMFASGKLSPNTRVPLKAISKVSTELALSVAKLTASKGWDAPLCRAPGEIALRVAGDKKGVYSLPGTYLLSEDFKLTKELQPELKLLFPTGYEPTQRVSFNADDADAAVSAGVGYRGKGSDYAVVTDQGWIQSQLIVALQRRKAEMVANQVEAAKRMVKDGTAPPSASEAEKQKERNKAERQIHLNARDIAHAWNMDLGKVLITQLSVLDVGSMSMDVAKVISLGLVGDRRSGLFLSGLRYCLPQYVKEEVVETKTSKTTKRLYCEKHEDAAPLMDEWLAGAKTPGELIGRTLVALIASVYADQGVVPQSARKARDLPRHDDFVTTLVKHAHLSLPKSADPITSPSAKFVAKEVKKLG